MKLLGNSEKKINKDKNSEKVAHLKITELVLVYCNIINNDYEHDSEVLYTFVPNKSFGQLLDISLKKLYLQKPLIEFCYIEVWFIDQRVASKRAI